MRNKYLLKTLLACAIMLVSIASCDDETGNIGGRVMPDEDNLKISQNIYSVFSRTVKADSVLGTTATSYLGKITDPETNATTQCEFLAQFHVLEGLTFPDENILVKNNGQIEADSVDIRLYISSYYGDSLNSMKLGVYELDTAKVMKENMIYYSNINPWQYVNNSPSAIRRELSVAVKDMTLSDSLQFAYSRNKSIRIKLPKEYGTFLMRKYYEDPESFTNSYNFIHHVCPGFYYRIMSGNGTMFSIDVSALSVYFRYDAGEDSVVEGVQRMAATEEVLQNTRIENKNIDKLLDAKDYTYLKTPVGVYTEVTLPIDSIYSDQHFNDTINSAKISFTRINDNSHTNYNLPMPKELLMIKSSELYNFFENSKVADGKTSYVTSFSANENAYTFNNISSLVSNVYSIRNAGAGVTPSDSKTVREAKYKRWEAQHPDWNKVLLVPVTTTYSQQNNGYVTQKVLTRVRNDLSLTTTRLAGGSTGDIKISVIYSKFSK